MKVKYQVFRGMFSSWETLFTQAAQFATEIGKDKLINISHSEDSSSGVVTVWYWSEK
jgi:hypothetical protein